MTRLNKSQPVTRKNSVEIETDSTSSISPLRNFFRQNSLLSFFSRSSRSDESLPVTAPLDDLPQEVEYEAPKREKKAIKQQSESITPESPPEFGSRIFPTQRQTTSVDYEGSLHGIRNIASYYVQSVHDTSFWAPSSGRSGKAGSPLKKSAILPASPSASPHSHLPHHASKARKTQAKTEVLKLLESIPLEPLTVSGSLDSRLKESTESKLYDYPDFQASEEKKSYKLKEEPEETIEEHEIIKKCMKKRKMNFDIARTFPSRKFEKIFEESLKAATKEIQVRIKAKRLEDALRVEKARKTTTKKEPHFSRSAQTRIEDDEGPLIRKNFRKSCQTIVEDDDSEFQQGEETAECINERLRPRDKSFSGNGFVTVGTATVVKSIDLNLPMDDEILNPPKPKAERPIKWIVLGDVQMSTWYHSPFPAEYVSQGDTLWICPNCLKYMNDPETYCSHASKCTFTHPPGREIYREKDLSVFEIDGSTHKLYCQNLCLIAKLYLDHKILYYDVNAFIFYVLTEYEAENGYRIVGYFSKERNTDVPNNLSCIVVFPGFQSKGYGFFLIDFSYLLTRQEGKVGGPETPLSDLGFLAYSKYWSEVLVDLFQGINLADIPSFHQMALDTGILVNHIVTTLEWMEVLMKKKDGAVAVNLEKILKFENMLRKRRRPKESLMRWKPSHK